MHQVKLAGKLWLLWLNPADTKLLCDVDNPVATLKGVLK